MTKRTVEIDDTLDERINSVISEVKQAYKDWLLADVFRSPIDEDNLYDTWYQGRDKKNYGCDLVHEIVDSNTPIYFSEIDGLYYLYGDEIEEAYKNQGLGDGGESNHRQVALYSYISEKTWEGISELEEKTNEFEELQKSVKGLNADEAEKQLKNFVNSNF